LNYITFKAPATPCKNVGHEQLNQTVNRKEDKTADHGMLTSWFWLRPYSLSTHMIAKLRHGRLLYHRLGTRTTCSKPFMIQLTSQQLH